MESGRGSGSLNHLNGKRVFTSAIGTTFVALVFKLFLRLGICEAQQKLDAILAGYIMKLCENLFCYFASLKSNIKKLHQGVQANAENFPELLPSKSNFFANTCFLITANLLRHNMVWLKMAAKILKAERIRAWTKLKTNK